MIWYEMVWYFVLGVSGKGFIVEGVCGIRGKF